MAGEHHGLVGIGLLVIGLLLAVAGAVHTARQETDSAPADGGRSAVTALTWLLGATATCAIGAGVLSTGELTVAGVGPFGLAALIVVFPIAVPFLLHRGRRDR